MIKKSSRLRQGLPSFTSARDVRRPIRFSSYPLAKSDGNFDRLSLNKGSLDLDLDMDSGLADSRDKLRNSLKAISIPVAQPSQQYHQLRV